MVINKLHDPHKKHKMVDAENSTANAAINCATKAIKYPNGVRQLNGNLKKIEKRRSIS